MVRTTGQNILSTLTLTQMRKIIDEDRWVINYKIVRDYIEPASNIDTTERTVVIRNTEDSTAFSDFESNITSYASLEALSLSACISHAENIGLFIQYVDNTGDLWGNETLPDDIVILPWEADVDVAAGFLRSYEGVNYYCVQKHTTQSNWTPDVVPALWRVAPNVGGGGFPLWVQPTGAQDAYSIGDKVMFPTLEDDVWESIIDANVWSPVTFAAGWVLV